MLSFVFLIACMWISASSGMAYAAEPPAVPRHRGHQWVRSHPFTLMGIVRMTPKPFDPRQYRNAEFSALLAWEEGTFDELLPATARTGMPFHVNLSKWGDELTNGPNSNEQTLREAIRQIDSDQNRAYLQGLLKNPGCIGFLANDEPVRNTYLRYTRQLIKWLRQQHPEAIVYSNAHPEGYDGDLDRYLDEFAAIVDPDVLMTDFYPLGHPDGTAYNYFKILAAVRRTALEQGMPYWIIIQSFETHAGMDRRLPSESDLRFQMFAALTYGYTGIVYFTYDIAFERGLIEPTGTPNAAYHAATKANREVLNVGAAMRSLTSTDVRYLAGQHEAQGVMQTHPLPLDTKAWQPGAGDDSSILDIIVETKAEGCDGLLGFFRDDAGQQYFMLTNLWHAADATADDRAATFTVKFPPTVRQVLRVNRLTGKRQTVPVDRGQLKIDLPGGTGELFETVHHSK